MTYAVFDYKAINRRFNRMDQKAKHDRKEAEQASQSVGWPMFGVPVMPLVELLTDIENANCFGTKGNPVTVSSPLTSLAHPEWPYSNTPHEWRKFKI